LSARITHHGKWGNQGREGGNYEVKQFERQRGERDTVEYNSNRVVKKKK